MGGGSAHGRKPPRGRAIEPGGHSTLPPLAEGAPGDDPDVLRTRRDYAAKIRKRWADTVRAVLDIGRHLIDAKEVLPHGHFQDMVTEDLGLHVRTAQRFMAIARCDFIDEQANATHGSLLPSSWKTLYELTRLGDDKCSELLEAGVIRSDMEHKDAAVHVKAMHRASKHAGLIEASERAYAEIGQKKYAIGVFDPPWRTEARSEKGLLKAADNEYPTMDIKDIKALPIGDMFLDHAVLFLWATNPLLDVQIECLKHWGFVFKSKWDWIKPEFQGTGYWGREACETLLIGRRGYKVGPPVNVPRSVWEIEFRGHSVKPFEIYEFIANEWDGLPMVEGFAREPKDDRFDVWGNEAGV